MLDLMRAVQGLRGSGGHQPAEQRRRAASSSSRGSARRRCGGRRSDLDHPARQRGGAVGVEARDGIVVEPRREDSIEVRVAQERGEVLVGARPQERLEQADQPRGRGPVEGGARGVARRMPVAARRRSRYGITSSSGTPMTSSSARVGPPSPAASDTARRACSSGPPATCQRGRAAVARAHDLGEQRARAVEEGSPRPPRTRGRAPAHAGPRGPPAACPRPRRSPPSRRARRGGRRPSRRRRAGPRGDRAGRTRRGTRATRPQGQSRQRRTSPLLAPSPSSWAATPAKSRASTASSACTDRTCSARRHHPLASVAAGGWAAIGPRVDQGAPRRARSQARVRVTRSATGRSSSTSSSTSRPWVSTRGGKNPVHPRAAMARAR